jgi:hypothetical protein
MIGAPAASTWPGGIDCLPDRHPLKTFVCFLVLYARDVQIPALPGDPSRYRPESGERYARAALMRTREFASVAPLRSQASPTTSACPPSK